MLLLGERYTHYVIFNLLPLITFCHFRRFVIRGFVFRPFVIRHFIIQRFVWVPFPLPLNHSKTSLQEQLFYEEKKPDVEKFVRLSLKSPILL